MFFECKHVVCLCLFNRLSKMWQRLARSCPRVCSGTSSESWDLLLYPLAIGGHFIQSILNTDTHILNAYSLFMKPFLSESWKNERERKDRERKRERLGKRISTQLKSMRSIKGLVSSLSFHVLHAAINMFEINHALCINKEKIFILILSSERTSYVG